MACDREFKQRILLKCYEALENSGFTRFRKYQVDYPIRDGFHCWVGLVADSHSDRIDLIPNVGVHVVPIEKLVCDFDQGPYAHKYDRSLATYSINIGQLDSCGDQRAFAFSPEQSSSFISNECERLAQLYLAEGVKYAKSISRYEKLAQHLNKLVFSLGGNPERYAACLYLMNRRNEAIKFLESFPDQYKEYIEGFAAPFLAKLQAEL
jgi:hypothetical protein